MKKFKKIRCYPTKPKNGGKPNFLVKVFLEKGNFTRIFWMSHEGVFLNVAAEIIWQDWPKQCNPRPIEMDLAEELVSSAIGIANDLSEAIESGQEIIAFMNRLRLERVPAELEEIKEANLKALKNLREKQICFSELVHASKSSK